MKKKDTQKKILIIKCSKHIMIKVYTTFYEKRNLEEKLRGKGLGAQERIRR